jgi:hypothetical protein
VVCSGTCPPQQASAAFSPRSCAPPTSAATWRGG